MHKHYSTRFQILIVKFFGQVSSPALPVSTVFTDIAKQIKELEKEVDEVKLKSGYCVYLEDKIKIDELEAEIGRLRLNEQNLSNENEKLRQKINDMRNQWNKLENDIKDVSDPNARYNIDDLIEDWDIR